MGRNRQCPTHYISKFSNCLCSCFNKAISIGPDYSEAHWNLSLALLLQGNWKEGWLEYEWRFNRKHRQKIFALAWRLPLSVKQWTGYNLEDKNIVVYAEQGVGDEIMFSSCIPDLVEETPKHIFLECDPRLEALFQRSFPTIHVQGKKRDLDLSWAQGHGPLDYSLPIGSLPKFYRNRVEDFPARDSFLTPEPRLVHKWQQRLSSLGEGVKIGISWRGGQRESVIRKASIPLSSWVPLLSMEAQFINLQYGDISKDIAPINEISDVHIHDWDDNDPLTDLDSQAALIATLDLVITIDNSTLHMAGAVGTQTWGLVEYVPDWRWPEAFGDTSPLYPSVQLFRQQQLSDWTHALEDVQQSLKDFLG